MSVHDTSSQPIPISVSRASHSRSDLQHTLEHVAHLLPTQGPITIFVHHNTLHNFENLPFDEAVKQGALIYGCQPYLTESRYLEELARGRFLTEDLSAVLLEDLGDQADELVGFMGTRFHLRLAMLREPLRLGTDEEVRWLVSETDALRRFGKETPSVIRQKMVSETRQWVMRQISEGEGDQRDLGLIGSLFDHFDPRKAHRWSDAQWESFTLQLLWRICHNGAHVAVRSAGPAHPATRHRDLLLAASGVDIDVPVNNVLIRFCAAFVDQGYATWQLPGRDQGYLQAFCKLYRGSRPVQRWMRRLPEELARWEATGMDATDCIQESLRLLGVREHELEEYLLQTLLALRGWAGMLWQIETSVEWLPHRAPPGTLLEFLAVRLLLERLALSDATGDVLQEDVSLSAVRGHLASRVKAPAPMSADRRALLVFQLAQARGWSPESLQHQQKEEWRRLLHEIESFSSLERRRMYQLAYERRYRVQALDAMSLHQTAAVRRPRKSFDIVTCIDDREESFRRHLEEVDPDCETWGAPGFFAVAMYYQSAAEANYRPLCPVIIKPNHFVREEASYSLRASSRQRERTRRVLGQASLGWHLQSRTFLGGILTAIFGSIASAPLLMRTLFPRLTSQLMRLFGSFIQPPPVTELMLLRQADPAGPEAEHLGYSLDEMTDAVERVLRDIGLTSGFAHLVFLMGHGSSSLNNPHESAYNCGACSGGRGGPNARAYAQMANDHRVRGRLKSRGLEIPEDCIFIGAYHNTCDEDVVYFDLDRVPISHRREFEQARSVIDEARRRNAHERCRRFESARLDLTPQAALEHVETRAEDLSQARPEYNHATNALCIVARRQRTRGLFLDRRAFLSSYDPHQDDEQATILARILQAAVPVCAGISLEYYFSCVDVTGFGCGSKLPHNIASMLGVMEGALSDLRTGLSQQMIEIHEPMRILFVIETTPENMLSIMDRNPTIGQMVRNFWVQMATLDPDSSRIHLYTKNGFEPYEVESSVLPPAANSLACYTGLRESLGFAEIRIAAPPNSALHEAYSS